MLGDAQRLRENDKRILRVSNQGKRLSVRFRAEWLQNQFPL